MLWISTLAALKDDPAQLCSISRHATWVHQIYQGLQLWSPPSSHISRAPGAIQTLTSAQAGVCLQRNQEISGYTIPFIPFQATANNPFHFQEDKQSLGQPTNISRHSHAFGFLPIGLLWLPSLWWAYNTKGSAYEHQCHLTPQDIASDSYEETSMMWMFLKQS